MDDEFDKVLATLVPDKERPNPILWGGSIAAGAVVVALLIALGYGLGLVAA